MFSTIWVKKDNLIRLVDAVSANQEGLICDKPRIVYNDELFLFGFDKYFSIPKGEHLPVCWAVDRRYFYKGDLIATVKSGDIFSKPTFDIDNSKHKTLRSIDINKLNELNQEKMTILENESMDYVKEIFNSRKKYSDAFVVSFSGGKDSQVVLDIVSRVLPGKDYRVVYMDTGMELPCTTEIVRYTKDFYGKSIKDFRLVIAGSDQSAVSQWNRFGPPSRLSRWCCSVRKTALFTRKMKEELNTVKQPKIVVFEGVRSEESVRREKYDRTAQGKKHINLMNARPLFRWNDTEVYLYFLRRNLKMNEGYYKGLTRIGCNICPFSSPWSESLINILYPDFVRPFIDVIRRLANNLGLHSEEEQRNYISQGFWKTNAGGRGLNLDETRFDIIEKKPNFVCVVANGKSDWKLWLNVLGDYTYDMKVNGDVSGEIRLPSGIKRFTIVYKDTRKVFTFYGTGDNLYETALLGKVMLKVAYCERCGVCEAECPTGALKIRTNHVSIDKKMCVHCYNCLRVHASGCIVASRRRVSEGGAIVSATRTSGVDKYSTFGLRNIWLDAFFNEFNDYFIDYGGCGSKQIVAMLNWLREAELVDLKEKKTTAEADLLRHIYSKNKLMAEEVVWINLCFNSPVVHTYVTKLNPVHGYTKDDLVANLQESFPNVSVATLKNPIGALINMFENSDFGYVSEKGAKTSNLKMGVISRKSNNKTVSIVGDSDISPTSIAYLLYKRAELDNRYEFRVSEFRSSMDLSPKTVFNLSEEKLLRALRTLNERNILHCDLVAGLDNIHLDKKITSLDVLRKAVNAYEKN